MYLKRVECRLRLGPGCRLQAPRAEHLAVGLQLSNALQVLSLAGNRVQATGYIAIAHSLRTHAAFPELVLSRDGNL
jgi:hypothetical protein